MTNPNKTLNKNELLNQTQAKRFSRGLLVHWFANHMPAVIKGQAEQKGKGERTPTSIWQRYLKSQPNKSANIGTEWHNYGGIKSCQYQTNPRNHTR